MARRPAVDELWTWGSGVSCRSDLGWFVIPKSDQLFENVDRRFLSTCLHLITKRCINESEQDLKLTRLIITLPLEAQHFFL